MKITPPLPTAEHLWELRGRIIRRTTRLARARAVLADERQQAADREAAEDAAPWHGLDYWGLIDPYAFDLREATRRWLAERTLRVDDDARALSALRAEWAQGHVLRHAFAGEPLPWLIPSASSPATRRSSWEPVDMGPVLADLAARELTPTPSEETP